MIQGVSKTFSNITARTLSKQMQKILVRCCPFVSGLEEGDISRTKRKDIIKWYNDLYNDLPHLTSELDV